MARFHRIYFLFFLSICLIACRQSQQPLNPIPVYGVKIKNHPILETHRLAAEIAPRYITKLSFRINGKVLTRSIYNGQCVKKGQSLALLDPTDYQLALQVSEAKVANAEFEAKQMISDEKRFKNLSTQGASSSLEYYRQKTQADKAQAQLILANKERELARNNLDYTKLTAPFSGIISNINFEEGEVIAKGYPIAVLYNPESMEVAVNLPEPLMNDIKQYQASLILKQNTLLKIPLIFQELTPIPTEGTQTYPARFSFLNKSAVLDKALLPGTIVQILFTKKSKKLYSTLPATALVNYHNKRGVWQYDEKEKHLIFRPIIVHQYKLNNIIVSGLPDNIIVLNSGVQKILPSSHVIVTLSSGNKK